MDVAIVQRTCQVGADVLVVEVRALADGVQGVADRKTILDDVLAFGNVFQSALVACGNIRQKGDPLAVHIDHLALRQRL